MTDIREKIKAKIMDDMNHQNVHGFADLWAERVAKLVEALEKSHDWMNRCQCIVSEFDDYRSAKRALEAFERELEK